MEYITSINSHKETYQFYNQQYKHIIWNRYANPKMKVKCLKELETDIQEWKEINAEAETEDPKVWLQICTLQHFVKKDKNINQSIIDRSKALMRKALKDL